MRSSALRDLVTSRLGPSAISDEPRHELAAHVHGLAAFGAAHVEVSEDAEFALDLSGRARLCRLFANGRLADLLAERTDPEINGPLSCERSEADRAHECRG